MRGGVFLAVVAAVAAVTLKGPPPRHATAYWRWMRGKPCPYAANPAEGVRAALQGVLVGQDAAVNDIVQRFQRWDADYHRGVQYPLVLTFTGSSGVGKTSSALAIARALSTSDRPSAYGGGGSPEPEALLKLDGGLYSEARARAPQQPSTAGEGGGSDAGTGSGGGTGEGGLRGLITDAIAQALYECNGQVIIVMDEAHKASPAAMQAFLPLLKGRQSSLAYRQNPAADARPTILDATRVVLMMTADVGASELEDMMLKAAAAEMLQQQQQAKGGDASAGTGNGNGNGIPPHALQERFRRLLLARDSEIGIDLGSHSHAVVPFLPFTQDKVQALLRHQLARVLGSMRPDSWDDVVFDAASVANGNVSGGATAAAAGASSSTLEALAEALSDGHFTAYTHDNARFAEIFTKLRQQQQQAGKQQQQPDGGAAAGGSSGGGQTGASGDNAAGATAAVDAGGNVQVEGGKASDDDTAGASGGTPSSPGDVALSCARAQTSAAFHLYGARGLDATYSNSPLDRLLDRLDTVLFKARVHDKDAPFPADALPPVDVRVVGAAGVVAPEASRATAAHRGTRAYRTLLGCMPAPGSADDVYRGDGRSTPIVDCGVLVRDRRKRVQAAVAEAAAKKTKLAASSFVWRILVTGADAGARAASMQAKLLTGNDGTDDAGGEQPAVWPRSVLRLSLACPPKAAARALLKNHPSRSSQWPVSLTITRCVREAERVDATVAAPAAGDGADDAGSAAAAAAAVPPYYFQVHEVCLPLRTGPI